MWDLGREAAARDEPAGPHRQDNMSLAREQHDIITVDLMT